MMVQMERKSLEKSVTDSKLLEKVKFNLEMTSEKKSFLV